jgi:GTP cyclohydrolase II
MQEAMVKPMQAGRTGEQAGAESAWKVVIVEEDEGGRIQREVRVHSENLSYERAMSEAQDINRQLSAERDA